MTGDPVSPRTTRSNSVEQSNQNQQKAGYERSSRAAHNIEFYPRTKVGSIFDLEIQVKVRRSTTIGCHSQPLKTLVKSYLINQRSLINHRSPGARFQHAPVISSSNRYNTNDLVNSLLIRARLSAINCCNFGNSADLLFADFRLRYQGLKSLICSA